MILIPVIQAFHTASPFFFIFFLANLGFGALLSCKVYIDLKIDLTLNFFFYGTSR